MGDELLAPSGVPRCGTAGAIPLHRKHVSEVDRLVLRGGKLDRGTCIIHRATSTLRGEADSYRLRFCLTCSCIHYVAAIRIASRKLLAKRGACLEGVSQVVPRQVTRRSYASCVQRQPLFRVVEGPKVLTNRHYVHLCFHSNFRLGSAAW